MYSVAQHLDDKQAAVSEIYQALLAALRRLGPVGEEPKKTCIHLVHRTGFAGVYPRKAHVNLEFKMSTPLEGPRIQKCERVSANRFHHTVRLDRAEDVDGELLAWLKAAYRLSA